MATKVLRVTIDEALAHKLESIAAETNRKKSYFVNQALKQYFEEIEDCEIARSRMGGASTSLDAAKKELGL